MTTIKLKALSALIAFCFAANLCFAQFNWMWDPTNTYRMGRLNPALDIRSIGIGNFAPANHPLSALHINTNLMTASPDFTSGAVFRTTSNAPAGDFNYWTMFTGAGAGTEKFTIAVPDDGSSDRSHVFLRAAESMSRFTFLTANDNATPLINPQMVITQNSFFAPQNPGETRVGIGTNVINPLTYLHIGLDGFVGSGYRTWMNKGMLVVGSAASGACATCGSDNMYVGLREISTDHADAIINWGNNPTGNFAVDRLRFVFTQEVVSGELASGDDGLEIARMISNGNFTGSRMGIGGDNNTNLSATNPYSGGSSDPQNTLEINSPATSAVPGQSGLRFTDFTSASTPVNPNPSGNVLSVDANGDVILVPGGGGVSFGDCNNPTTLNTNGAINLNGNDFYFSGFTGTNENVGIGFCGNAQAKLDVFSTTIPTLSTQAIAGRFASFPNNNCTANIGISSQAGANNINTPDNFGVLSVANSNQTGTSNYGIFAQAFGSGTNYAGFFDAFGGTPNDYAVYANTGKVWNQSGAGPWDGTSDIRLKTNIASFTDGLSIIRKINPITYNFNGKAGTNPSLNHIGVSGQAMDSIAPYLIRKYMAKLDSTDAQPTELFGINEGPLWYLSINAIKEMDSINNLQQTTITNLENRITQLEDFISNNGSGAMPNNNNNGNSYKQSSSSNSQSAIRNSQLKQNIPNPFSEKTRIDYALNEQSQVELNVYSLDGRLVSNLMRGQQATGNYSIDCCPNGNLPAGEYIYVLTVNGQQLQKKAVKIK